MELGSVLSTVTIFSALVVYLSIYILRHCCHFHYYAFAIIVSALYIPSVFRKKCLRFFGDFSGNSLTQKSSKAQTNLSNITGVHYFRMYQQVVSTLSFILYLLFILLPHYFHQLPFSPRSIGKDSDAVTAIVIACLFHRVGHRLRCRLQSCQSCIQYSGAGTLPFSAVHWQETGTQPLF